MSKPPPPGWGDDTLTIFLDNFRENQYATFANKPQQIGPLIEIDGLYLRFLDGALNPKPLLPYGFLFRAHSAYRTSVGAMFAGQIYEAQASLRLCLEHSAYSIFIGNDTDRWERWMARHDSAVAKKSVKDEFTVRNLRIHLEGKSPQIAKHFARLYDQTIDYGAHPNEKGYSLSSAMRKDKDSNVHIESVYLHGDTIGLNFGLQEIADVGIFSLHVAQLIYSEKFGILGITEELEKLRKRYW